MQQDGESIEDIFEKVQKIFESYHLDAIYYHMNLVFEFLKLEYYNHYKVYRQAEKYYEEVNDACANLLSELLHVHVPDTIPHFKDRKASQVR
jgi:hypothetical protein